MIACRNGDEGRLAGVMIDSSRFFDGGAVSEAFVSPTKKEFWPKAGSVLVNHADPALAPKLDFNNIARKPPFDVGAYESDGRAQNPGWQIQAAFKDTSNLTDYRCGGYECARHEHRGDRCSTLKGWTAIMNTDEIMKEPVATRRDFLQTAAAGAIGVIMTVPKIVPAGTLEPMRIEEPFHGAILNRRHGHEVNDGLQIKVWGQAPLGDTVTVNGTPAQRAGTSFSSEVVLRAEETEIVAVSNGIFGKQEHRIRVVCDRYSYPRYRFSIDDNSFFLRDIAQKNYASLFDCFYLKGLRELHTKYGTRFVLNIYYTTGDDFELPQFPDRYKSEWQDSADWLKLAFHAYANEPARPYQYAVPAQLIADLDKVAEQIIRFAGEKTYSPPTVIHWGMVQPTALKPLYERGVRVLSGYFRRVDGIWDINYLVDDTRSEYLSRHDALMDFDSGIVFSRVDIVCNEVPVERIVPTLEPLSKDPNRAEVMDLFTHEQYFWPFYSNYIPDHFKRLDVAIRWVTEHGYKPVFFHEGFLAKRDQTA